MRKFAFVFLFACIALPAIAAKRIIVDQLEQVLSAAHGRPDADIARQLSDLELTERLNPVKAAQWITALPGEDSRHALIALADASAFLDPPASEIPARPVPDLNEQRRMLGLTVAYVSKTIPRLPNFFATRETARFEDTPQLQKGDFFIPYQPIHRIGASSVTVLYRNGQEAIDTGSNKKPPPMTEGLTTQGVFGPILATVLLDAAQSKLGWSRWEQGPSGTRAVFSYAVPKEKSRYEVSYCCVAAQAATNAANVHPFRRIVGYHGEMTLDPATGTILRLIVEADMKPTDPVVKAAIMVEYGPVEIGGKTYFCPVKSVSSALAQTVQLDPDYKFALANQLQPLKNSLSDVAFEDYHVFRAEARVLAADAEDKAPALPSLSSANSTGSETAGSPLDNNASASASAPAPAPPAPASATPHASATAVASPPIPSPEPAIPEITVADATTVPDAPSNLHPNPNDTGFILRTTARLVDVGVVAYDKKGHPVADLKPEDFELYDDGRKQEISFFGQAAQSSVSQPAEAQQTASDAGEPDYTNRPAVGPAGQPHPSAAESNATILLIDSANLAWGDLSYARAEMLRFLKTLPAGNQVGLYILRSLSFQAIAEPTADHGPVIDKLAHWMPTAQDLARAQGEEQRNRQQFDYMHSKFDLTSVNGNGNTDPNNFASGNMQAQAAASPPDANLRSMGSNPERDVLSIFTGLARHVAAIPGHKNLVWVSSDNVLADWNIQAAARQDKGSRFIDPLALRAQEALNDAHTSIYPLDASQLEAGGIAADLGTRNVLVMGESDRDKATAALGDAAPGMKPGRAAAEMQQDTHPIQGAFRDLAEATGGRAFRRSSGIASELNSVVDDGRATWLLAFRPDQPADDKYHLITIKLNGRRDVTLHYRTGYQYNKEPATLKDRFRQAIWQPSDVTEIALTAKPVPAANGGTLKLNIAATDLDLAQQGNLWSDKLDIFLVQRDDEGLHAEVTGQSLGLRLKPETYQRLLHEGIPFEVKVAARLGTGSVRIFAVDENSGRIGSVTVPAAHFAPKP
jgi:VWFA-related protein